MEIQCEFFTSNGSYQCRVREASITQRSEVKSFRGHHESGKSNMNVEFLSFLDDTTVHFLPKGLSKFFPHLKRLSARNCGLMGINSNDLLGLRKLEKLLLSENCLKSLPDNLFVNTSKLKWIDFSGNQLTMLSSRLLNPLSTSQLELVNFRNNTNIDVCYGLKQCGNVDCMKKLKAAIDSSCVPPTRVNLPMLANNFKNLWKLSDFTDFTIVIDTKQFQVHKLVLAAQSPVFASMFKNDEQVKASNKLEIKDCNKEVVEDFLHCLYTCEVANGKNALELFSLACTFGVEELKNVYEAIVVGIINDQNALKALKLGNLYDSHKLIEAAFTQIKNVYPDDIRSDALKNDPEKIEAIIEHIKFIEELNKTE